MGLFRIKDLEFEIVEATFKAHISEGLRWSIRIKAEYPNGRIQGSEWSPLAYSEDLFQIGGTVLNRWSDILGQSIEWGDGYDEKRGEYFGSLCVFEHLDIYQSKLVLGPLISPSSFAIDWAAQCDVCFDDDYGKGLALTIQTGVEFEGIEVPYQDERESLAALRKHIREGEFAFDPGDGRHYKPIFRPL
ncbi:hypothetical protein BH09VER1_BH09VER1_51360 [soil metagenome]